MVEAESARRLAEEKAEEARLKAIEALSLEEELIAANRRVEESQRKLADVTSKNLASIASGSGGNLSDGHHQQQQQQHVGHHSVSGQHLDDNDNDNDEEDDNRRDNHVELRLNESLPPEQYREPVMDRNKKMKQQLEVCVFR